MLFDYILQLYDDEQSQKAALNYCSGLIKIEYSCEAGKIIIGILDDVTALFEHADDDTEVCNMERYSFHAG